MSAHFNFDSNGKLIPLFNLPKRWFCVDLTTKEVLFELEQEQKPEPVQNCEWRESPPFEGVIIATGLAL